MASRRLPSVTMGRAARRAQARASSSSALFAIRRPLKKTISGYSMPAGLWPWPSACAVYWRGAIWPRPRPLATSSIAASGPRSRASPCIARMMPATADQACTSSTTGGESVIPHDLLLSVKGSDSRSLGKAWSSLESVAIGSRVLTWSVPVPKSVADIQCIRAAAWIRTDCTDVHQQGLSRVRQRARNRINIILNRTAEVNGQPDSGSLRITVIGVSPYAVHIYKYVESIGRRVRRKDNLRIGAIIFYYRRSQILESRSCHRDHVPILRSRCGRIG